MELRFTIIYAEEVIKKDIPDLDSKSKKIIKKTIEHKLITYPEVFGKPLRKSLAGYRKLRVGEYRIIFEISKQEVIIWIIGHRREIYQKSIKRLK